jgi:hypothetical protein
MDNIEILFKHKKDPVGKKYIAQWHPSKNLPKTCEKAGAKIWSMPAHYGIGEMAEERFPISTYIEHQGKYYQVHRLDCANVFSPTYEVLC